MIGGFEASMILLTAGFTCAGGVDVALESSKLLDSGRRFLRGTSACLGGAVLGAAIGTAAGIIWPISVAALYTWDKMGKNTPNKE